MNNKTTCYPKNKKEKLLNWAKEYYGNSKENNQGRNIENYQTKKKRKERIWKK